MAVPYFSTIGIVSGLTPLPFYPGSSGLARITQSSFFFYT